MFEQFGWMHIVALLRGAGLTLGICVASTILGCILGVFLGMGELSSNKIVRGLCKAYVNLVRGIPEQPLKPEEKLSDFRIRKTGTPSRECRFLYVQIFKITSLQCTCGYRGQLPR